jgi:hypothetical protein
MAQVYPTIANPYMYNGTPDKTNTPTPIYSPGEIGCSFTDQNVGGKYLRVQLDSGATSATPVGAVAPGQLAYWKVQGQPGSAGGGSNTLTALVTNDPRFCDLGPTAAPNRVAGVFQVAVTTTPGVNGSDGNPQLYVTDLILQKQNATLAASGSITQGGFASANTAANSANAISSAVGTAAPTQALGVWTTATTSTSGGITVGTADINIGFSD